MIVVYSCAAVVLALAVASALARHPVHSVLALGVAALPLAALHLALSASWLAAAQLATWVTASLALLFFQLALAGPAGAPLRARRRARVALGGVAIALALGLAALAPRVLDPGTEPAAVSAGPPEAGAAEALGGALFGGDVLLVQAAGLLLAAGALAGLVLARRRS